MADQEVKIRITTDASGAITGFKTVRDEADKTEKHSASLSDNIKKHWLGLTAAAASVGAAWMAVSKAMDFVKLGADAQQAEESFKRVGASAGYTSEQMDKYSAAMKKASAGTVDDSDAMQKAVKGMALGLKPDDIVKLMEAARRGARLTGEDVQSAYEKITDSIATGMPKALKRYGLATTEEVAIVKAAVKAGVEDVDLLKIALINAAIQAEKMGTLSVTNAEKIQIFNAKINDAKEQLGIMALTIAESVLPAMGLLDKELAKDAGATWGKKFALAIIPIEAEILRLAMLLDKVGGMATAAKMYLYGPGSALGVESSKKRFEAAADEYILFEKRYYESDAALVKLAQKETQLQNELSGKGGKPAGGGADKGAQERIKGLEAERKALEDSIKAQTAALTGKKTPAERETDKVLEATRKAAYELEAVGQSQYEKDMARIQSEAEQYRKSGANKIAVAKWVATETALADGKNTQEKFKSWRQAEEAAVDAMKTEIDAGVKLTEERIKDREKFNEFAKESADELLSVEDHAMQDILDAEKKKYDYLAKLEADGVITHKEAEEEKRKLTEKRIKSEKEIETEKFMKANQEQQQIFSNLAECFDMASQLYAEDSKERQALSNAAKVATMAEIALQVQKNLMIAVGAVVNQGTGDPYTAFARIAAMIAVVSGVLSIAGIAFSGGSSSAGAAATPKTGDTTVLGGSYQQASESMANSLEKVEGSLDNIFNVEDVKLTKIYNELKQLNNNITGLVSSIFRTGTTDVSSFGMGTGSTVGDTEEGFNSYIIQDIGLISDIGNFLNKPVVDIAKFLFGGDVETSLVESGIQIGKVILKNAMNGIDIAARQYALYKTVEDGGLFGSDDVSWETRYGVLDDDVVKMLTKVFDNLGNSLVTLSEGLGADVQAVYDYVIKGTKLNLQNMDAEEMSKVLTTYFSDMADKAASDLFGTIIKQYQKVNEALYETAVRLVVDKESIMNILSATGHGMEEIIISVSKTRQAVTDEWNQWEADRIKWSDSFIGRITTAFGGSYKVPEPDKYYTQTYNEITGNTQAIIELSESLIELAGGLDKLIESAETYYNAFYSESEKMGLLQGQLTGSFAEMEMALPKTRGAFRDVVEGLDLTTKAGRENYVAMLNMAESADQYYSALEDIAKQRADMEIDLLELQGDAAGALARERAAELEEMDESLRVFQTLIYAQQDFNDLLEKSTSLLEQWHSMESDLLELQGDKVGALAAKRESELDALDESLRPLQELLYAQEDLNNARAKEITAVGNLITAQGKVVSELQGYVDKLKSARESMKMEGMKFAAEQVVSARLAFNAVLGQARMGDLSGIGTVDNAMSKLVENANSPNSFRTKQEYEENYYRTYNDIAELEKLAGTQLSTEEQTLNTLKDQLKVLNQIAGNTDNSDLSVQDAQNAVDLAHADVIAKQAALEQARAQYEATRQAFVTMEEVVNSINGNNSQLTMSISEMTTALLEAKQAVVDATAGWATYQANQTAADAAAEQARIEALTAKHEAEAQAAADALLAKQIADAKAAADALAKQQAAQQAAAAEAQRRADDPWYRFKQDLGEFFSHIFTPLASDYGNPAPGFASGGSFSGGYRVVGENGPELEYTGPSQITSNASSKALLDNSEVVKELKSLREDIKAYGYAIAKNTGKSAKVSDRWDIDGLPAERTIT